MNWRRSLFDWEIDELLRLDAIIEHKHPILGVSDGIQWRGSTASNYPIQSIVEKVYSNNIPILSPDSISYLWRSFAPPRARLTLWFAMFGKLKTGDFLFEKGIIDQQDALVPSAGWRLNQTLIFCLPVSSH